MKRQLIEDIFFFSRKKKFEVIENYFNEIFLKSKKNKYFLKYTQNH